MESIITKTTTEKTADRLPNYHEAVVASVWEFMDENEEFFYGMWSPAGTITAEEWGTQMEAELLNEDSVTGNASGSFFCNAYQAKEMVTANISDVIEALWDLGYTMSDTGRMFMEEEWEKLDVIARCYNLSHALLEVSEELDKNNMEMNGEPFFKKEN